MNCNLFGALSLFQACLPSMRARGDGRLIFVTSGAANNRPPGYLASYAASKAALASLVRSIAIEHGKDGIRCNGVHLGPVDGENFRPWIAGLAEQKGLSFEKCFSDYLEAEFPLRYVPTARECAGTVPYLASDLARVVTGQESRSTAASGSRCRSACMPTFSFRQARVGMNADLRPDIFP
ncbi:MAG: SDR family oxidoreductase [Gammaproteobacteria bacterium]|nr:SDR family oxidoreductase [Gammaproteobacteria bacterium]